MESFIHSANIHKVPNLCQALRCSNEQITDHFLKVLTLDMTKEAVINFA